MSDDETPNGAAALPLPPPPGAPLSLEATVVRRPGRGRLALGAALAVALAGGGLAIIAQSRDEQDAGAALRAAQAIVKDSDSYRFEMLAVSRQVIGEPDGAGSDMTTRSVLTGAVAAEDRWHVTVDPGLGFGMDSELIETIRVGDVVYATTPFSSFGDFVDVDAPRWIESSAAEVAFSAADVAKQYEQMELLSEDLGSEFDDSFDDSFLLDIVMMAYVSDLKGQPSAITRLVTEATNPVIDEQLANGGVRLRTTLAPIPELAEVAKDPIPAVDLLLDLNADDQPVQARFTAEAGTASSRVEVTFSDWGADVPVVSPAAGEIDRTPWLREEALAEVDPALLVAPSDLPESLSLVSVDVYPSGEFGEGDECDSVDLGYSTQTDFNVTEDPTADMSTEEAEAFFEESDHLSISVTTSECFDGIGETPFEEGGAEGFWDVPIGDAYVSIYTSFGEDVVTPLIASIRPVTVEELAAAIPNWAQTTDLYGGGLFGGPPGLFGL